MRSRASSLGHVYVPVEKKVDDSKLRHGFGHYKGELKPPQIMFFTLCLFMLMIATGYMAWRVYYHDMKKKGEKEKMKLEKNKAQGVSINKVQKSKD